MSLFRSILSVMLTVLAAMTAPAQAQQPGESASEAAPKPPPSELAGTWNLSGRVLNGPKEKGSITFKKGSGTEARKVYQGEWTSEMLGTVEIKEAVLDGNDFSFNATARIGNAELPVEFNAVIVRNHWSGRFVVKGGDQATELRFQGAKKVEFEKLTGPVNLPGDWRIEIEATTGNISNAVMHVTGSGSKYEAFIETEIGKGAVEGMKVSGNSLTFKTKVNFNGIMVPLAFEGTVGGDKIAGVARATFNQQDLEFPLIGMRGKAEAPEVKPIDEDVVK